MIENVDGFDGAVSLTCDRCGGGRDFGSFGKAVAFKRRQKELAGGWRSFKDGEAWVDVCPDCSGRRGS